MSNLIQKWQGSSSSLGEIYRYGLVRFMSLCKSVCFIRGLGELGERPSVSVCVERATDGQCDATCVCLFACFCGLDPMTVPQLSLNKFRAPLCYRGSVLGLNVSCFILWVLPKEHVQSKLSRATEVADTITSQKIAGSAGPSWTPRCFCACMFFVCFSGVTVDAT